MIPIQYLAIWFENLSLDPSYIFNDGLPPPKGMPEDWLEAIAGEAVIERRRYIEPGVLDSAVVILLDPHHFAHFNAVLQRVAHKLGTKAWVRDYADRDFRDMWDSGESIVFKKIG